MAARRAPIAQTGDFLDAAALKAVDEAARAIAGLLDIDEALQLIVESVRPLVGATYAALGIVGAIGATLRVESAKGKGTRIILMLSNGTDA